MRRILSVCSFILIVSTACFMPAIATPMPIPTLDVNQISTIVVKTAQALALSATATNTNIPTDTPSEIPSETPTFTSTVTNTATFTLTPSLTNTRTLTPSTMSPVTATNTFVTATPTKTLATKNKASETTTHVGVITSTLPVSPTNTSGAPVNVTTTPTATKIPASTPTVTPVVDPQTYVNYYRTLAGVPPVSFDAVLNNNCWEYARYMAENDDLTHDQNSTLPYASAAGQICAQGGNAWMGGSNDTPYWQPLDSIDGWMESVGHRLWLLYPTTPIFGYGFYTAENNSAAAGLDILSRMNSDADLSYANWPVRYPAPNQTNVPAINYDITLNWRYFGSSPTVTATSLKTSTGTALAHTVTTDLPVGHKGIVISPSASLPPNTAITVSVSGNYEGVPFEYVWSFTTGNFRDG